MAPADGHGEPNHDAQVVRTLRLAWLLAQEPGRWSRRALADRFDVTERTIARDIVLIRLALGGCQRGPAGYDAPARSTHP